MMDKLTNNLPQHRLTGVNTQLQTGANQNGATNKTSDAASIFNELINTLGASQGADGSQKQEGLPQNQDPDSYVKQYAEENGISEKEAKAELEQKFGKPQSPDQGFSAQA